LELLSQNCLQRCPANGVKAEKRRLWSFSVAALKLFIGINFSTFFSAIIGQLCIIIISRIITANDCRSTLTVVFQRMGLPIRKLICASNCNNVLSELINTGQYNVASRGAKAIATISPAIDITRASNFERFFHDAVGRNGQIVSRAYRELENTGRFRLPPQVRR